GVEGSGDDQLAVVVRGVVAKSGDLNVHVQGWNGDDGKAVWLPAARRGLCEHSALWRKAQIRRTGKSSGKPGKSRLLSAFPTSCSQSPDCGLRIAALPQDASVCHLRINRPATGEQLVESGSAVFNNLGTSSQAVDCKRVRDRSPD
ncbi:MAG: hypothetical protein MUF86_15790, partial [Akkermansiaceae bacterium]|nr:hypothetical protein [Akkermansiaceae bacterium]